MPEPVTVGIDVGTTSIKALAVTADGTVAARLRLPHDASAPAPDRLEHDAAAVWFDGVRRAWGGIVAGLDVRGACVAAMVPSLAAVDETGRPISRGLLYGDARGGSGDQEFLGFARWATASYPDAAGYWPAQAVANAALCGRGVLDTTTAMTAYPLFDGTRWAPDLGVPVDRLPDLVPGTDPAATVDGVPLAGGAIDGYAEQLVAGADEDGDVLVVCGTTLITWTVTSEWRDVDGLYTVPHSTPGKVLIGGPSNAGGLFLQRVLDLVGPTEGQPHPDHVPVWTPYIRGERTPLHDPARRAGLHGLDLTHGPAAVLRAAYEAAGYVVRQHVELAGVTPRRIVATGGGSRISPWVQALADCTALPVDVVAVPEGAALGAALLARSTAGLDTPASWVSRSHTIEPRAEWRAATDARYREFLRLSAVSDISSTAME